MMHIQYKANKAWFGSEWKAIQPDFSMRYDADIRNSIKGYLADTELQCCIFKGAMSAMPHYLSLIHYRVHLAILYEGRLLHWTHVQYTLTVQPQQYAARLSARICWPRAKWYRIIIIIIRVLAPYSLFSRSNSEMMFHYQRNALHMLMIQ